MKLITIFLFTCLSYANADLVLTKLIETPESVFIDQNSKQLFVSNVAGKPDEKDGRGWILVAPLSNPENLEMLVEGIHAPKGMTVCAGSLWVTNIDEVLEVGISEKKILNRYPIQNAKFLNDITSDKNCTVYISDTFGNTIYEFNKVWSSIQYPRPFVSGLMTDAPNGLFVDEQYLYVASWGIPNDDWSTNVPGSFFKFNLKTKEKVSIVSGPLGNLDGLEKTLEGNFIISDWMNGNIYVVNKLNEVKIISQGIKNPADIGYDIKESVLYIPSMSENKVIIKKLKE